MKLFVGEKTIDIPKTFDYATDSFDLNNPFTGFKMYEHLPKNAPDNFNKIGFVASFQLNPKMLSGDVIQIIFDFYSRNVMTRTHSAETGTWAWTEWKQIGGVTNLLSHIRQGLRYVAFKEMEVA